MRSKFFPFGYRGYIKKKSNLIDLKKTIDFFFQKLLVFSPKAIHTEGDMIFFFAGIFRPVWNTNLLLSIDKGEVEFERNDNNIIIKFDLSFRQITFLSLMPAFALFIFLYSDGGNLLFSSFASFVIFLCFSIPNILISIFRFRNFINNCWERSIY